MKPEVRKQLREALRSGKYKQGFGALYSNGCHCAVGVLCDISPVPGDRMLTALSAPLEVLQWSQLSPPEHYELVFMNDIERLTFDQIADRLEGI